MPWRLDVQFPCQRQTEENKRCNSTDARVWVGHTAQRGGIFAQHASKARIGSARMESRLSDARFTAGGGGDFAACGLAFGVGGGGEAPDLIGDADQEHGLAGVLEQIDDAGGCLFEEDGFSVG